MTAILESILLRPIQFQFSLPLVPQLSGRSKSSIYYFNPSHLPLYLFEIGSLRKRVTIFFSFLGVLWPPPDFLFKNVFPALYLLYLGESLLRVCLDCATARLWSPFKTVSFIMPSSYYMICITHLCTAALYGQILVF